MVGGYKVKIKHASHHVAIYMGPKYWCNGALISPKFVLTAAHCFKIKLNNDSLPVTVRIGSDKFNEGEMIPMNKYFMHKNYIPTQAWHDIALLKVSFFIHSF